MLNLGAVDRILWIGGLCLVTWCVRIHVAKHNTPIHSILSTAGKNAEDGRNLINAHQNTRRRIPKPADYLCFIVTDQILRFPLLKCLALSYKSVDLFVCYTITIDVFMFPVSNKVVFVSEYPAHPIPNSGSL
jgi:hypothetical protein